MKKTILLVAGAVVALLINEMFLIPPIGAARIQDYSAFAGTWTSGTGMEISVGLDGSVRGHNGNERLRQARLSRNRTWLGEKLNLRTDYIVIGTLEDGRRMTAPFNVRNGVLEGSWFVGPDFKKHPADLKLRKV